MQLYMSEMIYCTYRIHAEDIDEARMIARRAAVEQTVEVPDSLITEDIEEGYVGNILSVDEVDDCFFQVVIAFRAELWAGHFGQLLNLVYGNTSIHSRVKLHDIDFPDSVIGAFPGPNFGIDGLRKCVDVRGRALVCSALKPRGRSNGHYADLAGQFALGGGDLIKDDHNLVSASFDDFADRVVRCQEAVTEANARTGKGCLYLPYISARVEEIDARVEMVLGAGVRGILISPMTMGFDVVRSVAERYEIFVMSHPTMTGSMYVNPMNGIDMAIFIGDFMRLIGVDASVFTNYGGRFDLAKEECVRTVERLRRPMSGLARSWPVPAGGMQYGRMGELREVYGDDTILLIGGALLERGESLEVATRELVGMLA